MTYRSDEVGRILSQFKKTQFVALATFDGMRPRVRPMTLIYLDHRFWMVTSTSSNKVIQIKQNANVEFTYQFSENDEDCCIRILGKAKIIKDRETKASIAKRLSFFNDHWSSPEDPDYTLLEILPDELQHVAPSGMKQFRL
ncbi:MAG TPA: pyridoxamine 5'-phosphate oxidase family protein [Dehalococcoidia bacterium]|nr:pyridoxamine 5'-phosphate oxidase family protein [Dehalococcoidia bacterium]